MNNKKRLQVEGKKTEMLKGVLRGAGLAPGVGIVPDAAAGAITLAQRATAEDPKRKNELNKELAGDAAAMIPVVGQGTRGAQATHRVVRGARKRKLAEAAAKQDEVSEAFSFYRRLGRTIYENGGLIEGKTTGADPEATGARVQRGAEAAEKAGRKTPEQVDWQVRRIRGKVGAKHSDTGKLKASDRTFGNQGDTPLEDKREKTKQTTKQSNKARTKFVQGQGSAESPEAREKRAEASRQTRKDLKASLSRFPAGNKP